ncbi:PAAR-like domain-containing protein [Xanthomonas rydalmerensis]|uniref:GH-E family nuclease n=1 Tax=Xanthomonas rydalmerensis TaxID=3046274 RepID=A0ABZ0JUD9_9XANT|nr:GH-E family nuclease [Xanthomonas sp. DM-2023]WOS42712.1 GH-E family nuclease [Xanthomonas sp. DM-2023]WOS46898.1 GH-E family nuclease [Xanthomonas sp. DM-2023]WOS51077.1 GH-E family nuclease [Xanthomonas sp. DM-2023]WOS55258.1 GH-E family nuclease [Xanthomonas sp. DM-2023]WOS59440.1 GH-E family nuclease [Xanthomonas sp. DM-2023]
MARKHIAEATAKWIAVCTTPDVCKVGGTAVPFDSFRSLSNKLKYSPNVYARGMPVYRLTDWVRGTDANAGMGVVSQTSQQPGHVRLIGDNTSVKVNGLICARHDTIVQMNVGPGGPNTVGKLITEQSAPAGVVKNGKLPCNDPPKTSPELERLQQLKEKLSFMNPDQLDEYIRFGDWSKSADETIASIDMKNEGGWSTAGHYGGQVARGALGFVKDIGLGLGQLLYTVGKKGNIAGALHSNLDAQILAEQIRLGNVCLETLKQAAKAAGHELTKPVTDAWEKGNYVEAVTRAGLEIGSLVLVVGDVAKLAQGAKAVEAASAGVKAADAVSAGSKAGEGLSAGGKAAEGAGAGGKAAEGAGAGAKVGDELGTVAKPGEASKAAEAAEAAGVPVEEYRVLTKKGKSVKEFSTRKANGVKIKARSLRELFLGKTPGKKSATGKKVIERMESEGKIRNNPRTGEQEFKASDGEWYKIDEADMAHYPRDAVSYWNEEGRKFGARSPEVRAFMNNPDNYVLDHFSLNRSSGASLGETYLPPLK